MDNSGGRRGGDYLEAVKKYDAKRGLSLEERHEWEDIGQKIYSLAGKLFPINRSITGNGVRETLALIKEIFPGLMIHEIPSGTKVFDWTVPKEWNVRDAYIECPDGRRIAEFKKNNLHLVGYSVPTDKSMTLE